MADPLIHEAFWDDEHQPDFLIEAEDGTLTPWPMLSLAQIRVWLKLDKDS